MRTFMSYNLIVYPEIILYFWKMPMTDYMGQVTYQHNIIFGTYFIIFIFYGNSHNLPFFSSFPRYIVSLLYFTSNLDSSLVRLNWFTRNPHRGDGYACAFIEDCGVIVTWNCIDQYKHYNYYSNLRTII